MGGEKKKLYMWITVICISLVIGAIWIALIRYNISISVISSSSSEDIEKSTFLELQENFKKQMQEMKNVLEMESVTSTQQEIKISAQTTSTQ